MTANAELSSSTAPTVLPLIGCGEMGQRISDIDWSATLLGDYATWPEALVALVRVLLVSRQPMFITWGPERVFLYSDSAMEVLDAEHPSAFGQRSAEVWSKIWTDIGHWSTACSWSIRSRGTTCF